MPKFKVSYQITGRDLGISCDDGPAIFPVEMECLMAVVKTHEQIFKQEMDNLVEKYVMQIRNGK